MIAAARRRMRTAAPLVLAAILVAALAACTEAENRLDVGTPALQQMRAEVGLDPCAAGTGPGDDRVDALPELTLPCLGGGTSVDLASLRGPMVIPVWAQWCGPCREELPIFQQLEESGSVDVMGINYLDTQPAAALALLESTGVTFPSVADPGGELKEAYPWLTGLPLLMMIDADGAVAFSEFREISSYDELAALVEDELGVAP